MKVGLIKGRHNMPVDIYLITDKIEDKLLKKENLFQLTELITINISKFIKQNYNEKTLQLYLTGISRIQHIVIRLLTSIGFNVEIWDYDKDSEDYFLITVYERLE